MTTKRKPKVAVPPPPQPAPVSLNHVNVQTGVNAGVTNAVEAIALAAKANAEALQTAAEALKGNTGPSYGIYIDNSGGLSS